jgi:hypothetical protein
MFSLGLDNNRIWLGDYLKVLTYSLMELKVGFICKGVAMVCS